MPIPVMISVSGTQHVPGERPETIELATRGEYRYEPSHITLRYAESELTGLQGVVTSFSVEQNQVVLRRTGKLNSVMTFRVGQPDDSLYDMGFGGLFIRVCATKIAVLLNEKGGILDLEYTLEIEGTSCGTNSYHITVRPLDG